MILGLISKGFTLGCSAGISPGPLTLLVVSQTLRYGFREGAKVSLAPVFTDIPIIALVYILFSNLSSMNVIVGAISILGGLFLLMMAKENWTSMPSPLDLNTKTDPQSFRKGMIANFLNPSPYLFWLSIGGPIMFGSESTTFTDKIAFVASLFVGMILIKLLIASAVKKSTRNFNGAFYKGSIRASSVVFILFSIKFLTDGYEQLRAAL